LAVTPTRSQPETPTENPTVNPTETPTETAAPVVGLTGWRARTVASLQAREDVQLEMLLRPPSGVFLCAMQVLDRRAHGTVVYAFVTCGDYRPGPNAELLSASSLPAVIRRAGPPRAREVTSVDFPRQQSLREDIQRLFPADLVAEVVQGNPQRLVPTDEQRLAIAEMGQPGS
jgi:hypothetical protein